MTLKLPRLPRGTAIVSNAGVVLISFQRWWQAAVKAIEDQEARQDEIISDLQDTQADLVAAQADIAAAQADIVAQLALIAVAQADADAVTLQNAISASFISPASPLSATDAGSDATISIADFTRTYDDATSILLDSIPDITGLDYDSAYSVYYDDATRANADPTFAATKMGATARHNAATGRHFVGEITTPASGGSDTSGGDYFPPGGGGNVDLP